MSKILPVVPRGGLPPREPWHNGKTPYSIDFADAAKRFVDKNPHHTGVTVLQEAISKVQSGDLVFQDWTTPEQYLEKKLTNKHIIN